MKRFIVEWWDGQDLVSAENEEAAKEYVRRNNTAYVYYGRRAPLFAKEVA